MNTWRVVPLLFLLAVLSGCETPVEQDSPNEGEPRPTIEELPRALTAGEEGIQRASNQFGFDLLSRLHESDPGATVFLSPLSASMALGMTMSAAEGPTWEGMREALRFEELDREEIEASYRSLIHLLRELDPAVTFELANSIWYRYTLEPDDDFVATVREAFDAEIQGLDFSDPGAADVVNGWVEEKTRGRIEEILSPPLDPSLLTLLLNAIFFKGDWTDPFDPSLTEPGPFHLPDGGVEEVLYMDRTGPVLYRSGASYQAVELPYGAEAFAMTVIVPREGRSVGAVLEELAQGEWETLVEGLIPGSVRLLLPRFELEWEAQLKDPLTDLGMGLAFTPAADFTRMFTGVNFWIDFVKQKTFVRVDEEGTEAAAVTAVGAVASAPQGVRADRPFLFVIRERLSGTILFLGAVMEAPKD